MRKASREEWVPAFERHFGMNRQQVMKLSETEFINQRDYLELEGISPGKQPDINEEMIEKLMIQRLKKKARARKEAGGQQIPASRVPQRAELTEEQQKLLDAHRAVQQEQDIEYEQVLAQAREMEKQEAIESEKKRVQAKENPIETKKKEMQRKFSQLPPEPSDGLTIAVMMPNQKRIMRKFGKTEKGENVFVWVASNEEMHEIPNFELRIPGAAALDIEKSLEEQGIVGRTLFNVVVTK